MFTKTNPIACLGAFAIVGAALLAGCGGSGTGDNPVVPSNNHELGGAMFEINGMMSDIVPLLSPGDQVQLVASGTVQGVSKMVTPYNYVVYGGSSVGTVTAGGLLTVGPRVTNGTLYSVYASSIAGTINWTFMGGKSGVPVP